MKKATGFSRDEEKVKNKAFKVLEDLLNIKIEPVSEEDREFFEFSTGRKPDSVVAVVRRCKAGYPLSFASLPVVRGEYFPTIFWLTCPYLIKICGKLESALYHQLLENEISRSPKLSEELLNATGKLRKVRIELARAAEIELPEEVAEKGIGGVKNPNSVKCLHAHLAAGLAGIESPVSKAIYEAITVLECGKDCRKGEYL